MQKLIETLGSFGIEIPEDKQADVKKHCLSITKTPERLRKHSLR